MCRNQFSELCVDYTSVLNMPIEIVFSARTQLVCCGTTVFSRASAHPTPQFLACLWVIRAASRPRPAGVVNRKVGSLSYDCSDALQTP